MKVPWMIWWFDLMVPVSEKGRRLETRWCSFWSPIYDLMGPQQLIEGECLGLGNPSVTFWLQTEGSPHWWKRGAWLGFSGRAWLSSVKGVRCISSIQKKETDEQRNRICSWTTKTLSKTLQRTKDCFRLLSQCAVSWRSNASNVPLSVNSHGHFSIAVWLSHPKTQNLTEIRYMSR